MKNLTVSVSEDASRLVIKSDAGDALAVTTEELHDLIPLLLSCRAAMKPALPYRDAQSGDRLIGADGMRWWFGWTTASELPLLALHHPGLGWVASPMTPEGLSQLQKSIEEELPKLADYKPPVVQ